MGAGARRGRGECSMPRESAGVGFDWALGPPPLGPRGGVDDPAGFRGVAGRRDAVGADVVAEEAQTVGARASDFAQTESSRGVVERGWEG